MSEANYSPSTDNSIASNTSEQNSVLESQLIAETNREKEINLQKFAHKLREHNRKLLKKVFQLEQEIIESNQALEEQRKISQNHYLCVAKQAEKINQYQEENSELLQQLAADRQKNHSQKAMVANLNQQLESSQQKASKLEKDYAELQAVSHATNSELLDKQQQIQELTNRLNRQKQYLLEPKNSNYEKPASQPIKAWSANSIETTPLKTTALASELEPPKTPDWPAPAIAKNLTPNKSLAAVKLPQFPRRTEGE